IDVPTNVQFTYFKRIVPGLKRIGVLYTDSTAALIPGAQAEAKRLGMNLIAIKVGDVKELPKAMDSLSAIVEGIWSLADPNLFDPQSTRYILLNSLRKSIPFMGFSRNVVESGALFALDFDYKAVGRQAGEIANRIIAGEKPGNIPVTSADVIWFHYNEKTAQHIHVRIPEELVAVAKEVYR
ncbi:MAG: ABC transporter substrate-binding protein, partial [Candidatus Zixiibacteriota bacterium]